MTMHLIKIQVLPTLVSMLNLAHNIIIIIELRGIYYKQRHE